MIFVVRRCVNAMEAKMETPHLVEEDGREVNASVGCKAMAITLQDCLSLLTLAAMYTPTRTNVDGYFHASIVLLNGSLWVGTPSESSHIAAGPLKRKLLL